MTLDTVAQWGGWVVGLFTVAATVVQNRRKTDVDESTLILGKWKELVEQHQADIKMLKDEFAIYKTTAIAEIADLRGRLVKAEKRISELEDENRGLKRAIAQNSQSSAILLDRNAQRSAAGREELQEQIAALDQAGHNSKGDV